MKLARLAKTYFSLVTFALVALAAFLHATAVTQIMGFRMPAHSPQLASRNVTTPSPAAPVDHRATSILDRNAFDSVTGPIREVEEEPAEVVALPEAPIDAKNAPPCEGLKVVAIAASSDPEWSLASFVPTSGAETKPLLRRRGGAVTGSTVQFIGDDRVWLSNGAKLCQVGLWSPPPPPAAAPKAAGHDPLLNDIANGIRRRSATEFTLQRAVVEKVLENTTALMGQVQLAPGKDGATGLRLGGVKPESVLGLLGLENGDVLKSINGFDITNPEKALEAYARLGTAPHLTLLVGRKGSATNLDYDVE